MVPWSIAVLSVGYGVLATVSLATVWKILGGAVDRPLIWPVAWLALSTTVMCGLPLLKSWARRLAIAGSVALLVTTLAVAGALVASGRPGLGLAATLGAGVHVLIIRYLQRPSVKAWFTEKVSDTF